jgi:polysaccharide biosynthesis transport protein
MQEPEEPKSGGFDFERLAGIARRHHLHFLIPLFIGWGAVWAVSWILPARYRSGTLIFVEQQTMPKDYVTPNIADDLQERLQSISQQILSRTRLLHIIDGLHLYSGSHDPADLEAKVDRMRKDIDIELVRDGMGQVTAFNIYYSSDDPHIAQRVTSELTNLFIDENLEVRQQQSEGTTKFLADQLEAARGNLAQQEAKVREFKSQHMGELPGQLAPNLQILSGLQAQLQTDADALNAAKQQRTYMQTLINQYAALQVSPKNANDAPLSLPALDQQLETLRAQLVDFRSRYTDRHPDVRKLKEQIAETEQLRQQVLADSKRRAGNAQKTSPNTASDDIGATNGAPAPMTQLESQLQANEVEISNRERSLNDLKSKIADYQARLNAEPVREQQLTDLTRGYDQSKADYDDLLKKKNESAMATSMELRQQGERFRVIDPPDLPVKPDFPNRLKFCGMGLGVGLALGIGVIGLLEMIDDRLYAEKEIKDLLSVPIISEIPVIVNPSDERTAKRKLWLGWASAAVVVAAILAGSAFSYFRG